MLALIFSFVIGRAFDFLNLSSLHAAYAARLTRTFLGASNEERVYGSTADDATDVKQAHPRMMCLRHVSPERSGGPLHLINVCLNETVDLASDRNVPSRKGLPMCINRRGERGASLLRRMDTPRRLAQVAETSALAGRPGRR